MAYIIFVNPSILHETGMPLPAIVAATKADEATENALSELAAAEPRLEIVPVSVLDDASFLGAGGTLMGHRLDFPGPSVGRIGWVAMPRVGVEP